MSDEQMQRMRPPSSSGSWYGSESSSTSRSGSGRPLIVPLLALAAGVWVLALAEIGQGWEMTRLASSYEVPADIGDLVSTTLVNGQVFFGTLDAASRTTIRLRDVFFAQLPAQDGRAQGQDADARAPTILRRKDNEWTEADVMAIPVARIAFMETVGLDSRIARFIFDARSHPSAIPTGPSGGQRPGADTGEPPRPASPPSAPPKG